MLGSIYTGLAGMIAYSRGLDLISNNVANLNTPGFKAAEPLFRDLVFRAAGGAVGGSGGSASEGAGVSADEARPSFRQGDLRSTGNPLDAAVDGNGFFVLDRSGELVYTRAGQFEIDGEGFIVDRGTKARVMFATSSAAAGPLNIDSLRVFAPRATTEVKLSGNLARAGTTTTFDLPQVTVIDAAGGKKVLKARFVRDAADALRWRVEVMDTSNKVLGQGEIRFNEDGTPHADSARLEVRFQPDAGAEVALAFTFGEPGRYSGVTSLAASTASQVQVLRQDGVEAGTITQFAFTDKGELEVSYSNGEKKSAGTVVLARFDAPEQLRALGEGLYAASGTAPPVLGVGLASGIGRVIGGQVELSNVELTEQFTDLIIIQRGYQASSQMTSVANEMMQQLIQMQGGR